MLLNSQPGEMLSEQPWTQELKTDPCVSWQFCLSLFFSRDSVTGSHSQMDPLKCMFLLQGVKNCPSLGVSQLFLQRARE